jgi:hypothetical protein
VLPCTDYAPPGFEERRIVPPVASDVVCDLRRPIIRILTRPLHVFWTAVPKATVHENGNSFRGEHDVYLATETGDWPEKLANSESPSMQFGPDCPFRA